ncbi:tetratricopeptide repeat protein [Xanthobacter oligotrophicus]|uniref:tetratricopeptide repeat protein n=1 Tax=Xanthobacter oligotrophicus TaxID=2607286 RepID=UPI0011F0BEFA|nr:tetratricopeptide repeat protein [Xanthobacter oligotrophicus]MCG5236078.1 sel1 repeat family protein [Xanthobacter oligotrophicus]
MWADTRSEMPDVPAWDVFDIQASTIESLRGEVSALRDRLSNAAPKRAVQEMDKAITLLCRRVDDIRAAGAVREDADHAFAEELAAIRVGVAALREPAHVRALQDGLDALARRIDLMAARAVDPVEVARLTGQMEEIHHLVLCAAERHDDTTALHALTQRLQACAEAVAGAGEETVRRVAEATGAFERKAEALLSRVIEVEARARAGDSAAAQDLQGSLLGALEGVHRRLDAMSSTISGQVTSLSPTIGAEMTQRLSDLSERIAAAEEAGKAAIAPLADAVERTLADLSAQFRDTHARLDRLDDIEIQLQHMVAEMRQVRETTHVATAEAVAAVAAKVSEDPDGAAVVGLKRGLAALEARQDEIERRAGEMLAAELEYELRDISVALDRDGEGTFAPRPAPRTAERPAASSEAEVDEPFFDAASFSADAADAAAGAPWPRSPRRADRAGPAPSEGVDSRPRVDRRARRDRTRDKRAPKGFVAGLFARKRQVAMVALLAGATTVFAGTAVGLAWRNGPDLLSGVTQALRRLSAPAVAGVTAGDLPAAIGPTALQAAARAGDPAAAFLVAGRYAEGRGVEADPDAAVKWLAFAMQRGSAPAAHRLGALYESAGRDLGEARRFYEWAAGQGNVRAMHALAMLLCSGNGQTPDWEGAVRWFRAAAELGFRDSQYNLGVVYARGLGVAADAGEAFKWLSLAAVQGDDDSGRKRDILAREADGATLTKAQQAVAAFAPGPQNVAANIVEIRPEWQEESAGTPVASLPGRSKSATRLASTAAAVK